MQGQLQKLAKNVVYPLHPRNSGSQHRISHELDEHSLATPLILANNLSQLVTTVCHGIQHSLCRGQVWGGMCGVSHIIHILFSFDAIC